MREKNHYDTVFYKKKTLETILWEKKTLGSCIFFIFFFLEKKKHETILWEKKHYETVFCEREKTLQDYFF
jgi:hypothetical protein